MPGITADTDEAGPVEISYSVYLADLDNYPYEHALDSLVRCPQLFENSISRQQITGVTAASATYHFDNPPT